MQNFAVVGGLKLLIAKHFLSLVFSLNKVCGINGSETTILPNCIYLESSVINTYIPLRVHTQYVNKVIQTNIKEYIYAHTYVAIHTTLILVLYLRANV